MYEVNRITVPRSVQGKESPIKIPKGWEPFTVTIGDGLDVIWIRREVKSKKKEAGK
jgi:hypothetical protein